MDMKCATLKHGEVRAVMLDSFLAFHVVLHFLTWTHKENSEATGKIERLCTLRAKLAGKI